MSLDALQSDIEKRLAALLRPASLLRSHISSYENLFHECVAREGVDSRARGAIHFHFGTRVVTFVAFLQPLSMSMSMSIRGEGEAWQREKNKASLACSIQKLFFAACREKKWRYDDALRYALCIRKDELRREGR